MLKKAKNFNLFKLSKKYYEKRFFNEDDYEKIHIKKGQEEESKNLREKYEALHREKLREAQEIAKQRFEQLKSGNREFLRNFTVPGVNSNAEEKLQVYALKNGFFSVNNMWIPGSVLLFPKRAYMWGVVDAHEIKEHTLDILKVIKPKPNYLIIGTGKYNVEFPQSFYEHFKKFKIMVDVMPTVN